MIRASLEDAPLNDVAGLRTTAGRWWARRLTDAGRVMLGEARGTLAGEATDGVNAQELTVVLFGGTLVQI